MSSTVLSLGATDSESRSTSSHLRLVPIGAADLLLERCVLDAQYAVLRSAPKDRDEFVVAERLLDVIERALVHGLHRGLERGLRGHEDHGRVRIVCARRRENVDAAHLRSEEHTSEL